MTSAGRTDFTLLKNFTHYNNASGQWLPEKWCGTYNPLQTKTLLPPKRHEMGGTTHFSIWPLSGFYMAPAGTLPAPCVQSVYAKGASVVYTNCTQNAGKVLAPETYKLLTPVSTKYEPTNSNMWIRGRESWFSASNQSVNE